MFYSKKAVYVIVEDLDQEDELQLQGMSKINAIKGIVSFKLYLLFI